ncbi:M28 family metallopeptidase [Clostridium paraputrificum]|uniref:M28 family metallopeptidase n=1 Tax=Clostridium paraputrificum TaxID=29363 RepID=UPI003D34DCCC
MKKLVYILITLLSLAGLITCLILKGSYYDFNPSNVKNNIEYLSSTDFKGRLTGSDENYMVGSNIESTFKEYNLKPLGKDFKEGFNVMTPTSTNANCSLKILEDKTTIKEFTLGEDFKEDMLNFKDTSIQFTNEDKINIYQKSLSITKGDIEYLFYVTYDKEFSFRSSFINDSEIGFAMQINTSTFNEILDSLRSGYTLDVQLPYKVQQKEVFNIVGKIDGTSKNLPPLIITSHYDHVGADTLNSVYYGALDNASGTAFMLELARSFSTLKMPKRDIIFVALNGEEFGLLGSKAFSNKYKDELKGAEVINFDMIGVKDCPITLMEGANSKDNGSNLLQDLEIICDQKNIKKLVTYQDSSDHASFINDGFDSLTISHADVSNIHTPRDTPEKISTEAISSVYDVVESKILDYAYENNFLIFYNSKTLIFFSLSTFTLIGFGIIQLNKLKKFNENNANI